MKRRLYDDVRWRKARAAFLRGHPLCAMCAARGIVAGATVVDHVVPHRRRPGAVLGPGQLATAVRRLSRSRKQMLEQPGKVQPHASWGGVGSEKIGSIARLTAGGISEAISLTRRAFHGRTRQKEHRRNHRQAVPTLRQRLPAPAELTPDQGGDLARSGVVAVRSIGSTPDRRRCWSRTAGRSTRSACSRSRSTPSTGDVGDDGRIGNLSPIARAAGGAGEARDQAGDLDAAVAAFAAQHRRGGDGRTRRAERRRSCWARNEA